MEWTGVRYADGPTVEVSTGIEAPPERVWSLVSDIAMMPTTSSELQSVEWLDDVTAPSVGARFRGHNRHKAFGKWSTTSIVTACDPERVFGWVVEDPWAVGDLERPAAAWRFTLDPDGSGTVLTQWVRLGPGRSGVSILIERMPDQEQQIVFVRLRELKQAMTRTIAEVKARAERS